MKTILRIIIVLLVASAVAGAFSLAVNNSSIASSSSEGGQPPAMTSSDGTTIQPTERPEGGDHEGGSIAGGLSGVLTTLAKLTGITLLILAFQKVQDLFGGMKRKLVQQ
jgi:hypothetical protein